MEEDNYELKGNGECMKTEIKTTDTEEQSSWVDSEIEKLIKSFEMQYDKTLKQIDKDLKRLSELHEN